LICNEFLFLECYLLTFEYRQYEECKMNKMKIAGLCGSVLLLCGAQAQAGIDWKFNCTTGVSGTLGNTVAGKTPACAAPGDVTVDATAWSNTNNGTSYTNTSPITTNAALGSDSSTAAEIAAENAYKLERAYLNVYSGGLGVKNQDASTSTTYGDESEAGDPEHSTDNNQRYDSVLFKFSSDIDLNSVTIGWHGTDSDITVLAYTATGTCVGSGTCTSDVSGKKYADLASYGWSLIGQYTDLHLLPDEDPTSGMKKTKSVNAGDVASSYWLIGAANTLVGGDKDGTRDYVKLLGLSGDKPTNGTPEPGTLLLMGAGLFGLYRMSRRNPARSLAA
jgi:hypothetical protein